MPALVLIVFLFIILWLGVLQHHRNKKTNEWFSRFLSASVEIKKNPQNTQKILKKYGFTNRSFLMASIKVRSALLHIREKKLPKSKRRKVKIDKKTLKLVKNNYFKVINAIENKR